MALSAIGFGTALGTLLMPWLSDSLGRKPAVVLRRRAGTARLASGT